MVVLPLSTDSGGSGAISKLSHIYYLIDYRGIRITTQKSYFLSKDYKQGFSSKFSMIVLNFTSHFGQDFILLRIQKNIQLGYAAVRTEVVILTLYIVPQGEHNHWRYLWPRYPHYLLKAHFGSNTNITNVLKNPVKTPKVLCASSLATLSVLIVQGT